MILIFAVDNNWNIGFAGGMLTEIKADLKRFREITEGNIVIMGRKTLEAIPGQKPLPNRINILITRNKEFNREGFYTINDLKDLFPLLREINPKGEMEVFLTGGGSVVRQLIDHCNKAYITKILKDFEKADTSIPNLDLLDEWKIVSQSDIYYQNELPYKYVDYVRK
ncbi:dihydrofolate reductase [Wansuia hejianensis]|uniref:dihydrofolate reductase n=1 Tax=Wansuia hejianensis TaxID=2763667 RepID=A0A926EXQ6_9FIRM|nr:dihydrofolate reductase [Wansuia hejianensis]MBC8590273.1 dihydrofolate reductase [Wansuia hejianensis]